VPIDHKEIDAMHDRIMLEPIFERVYDSLTSPQREEFRNLADQADDIILRDEHTDEEYARFYGLLDQMSRIVNAVQPTPAGNNPDAASQPAPAQTGADGPPVRLRRTQLPPLAPQNRRSER